MHTKLGAIFISNVSFQRHKSVEVFFFATKKLCLILDKRNNLKLFVWNDFFLIWIRSNVILFGHSFINHDQEMSCGFAIVSKNNIRNNGYLIVNLEIMYDFVLPFEKRTPNMSSSNQINLKWADIYSIVVNIQHDICHLSSVA